MALIRITFLLFMLVLPTLQTENIFSIRKGRGKTVIDREVIKELATDFNKKKALKDAFIAQTQLNDKPLTKAQMDFMEYILSYDHIEDFLPQGNSSRDKEFKVDDQPTKPNYLNSIFTNLFKLGKKKPEDEAPKNPEENWKKFEGVALGEFSPERELEVQKNKENQGDSPKQVGINGGPPPMSAQNGSILPKEEPKEAFPRGPLIGSKKGYAVKETPESAQKGDGNSPPLSVQKDVLQKGEAKEVSPPMSAQKGDTPPEKPLDGNKKEDQPPMSAQKDDSAAQKVPSRDSPPMSAREGESTPQKPQDGDVNQASPPTSAQKDDSMPQSPQKEEPNQASPPMNAEKGDSPSQNLQDGDVSPPTSAQKGDLTPRKPENGDVNAAAPPMSARKGDSTPEKPQDGDTKQAAPPMSAQKDDSAPQNPQDGDANPPMDAQKNNSPPQNPEDGDTNQAAPPMSAQKDDSTPQNPQDEAVNPDSPSMDAQKDSSRPQKPETPPIKSVPRGDRTLQILKHFDAPKEPPHGTQKDASPQGDTNPHLPAVVQEDVIQEPPKSARGDRTKQIPHRGYAVKETSESALDELPLDLTQEAPKPPQHKDESSKAQNPLSNTHIEEELQKLDGAISKKAQETPKTDVKVDKPHMQEKFLANHLEDGLVEEKGNKSEDPLKEKTPGKGGAKGYEDGRHFQTIHDENSSGLIEVEYVDDLPSEELKKMGGNSSEDHSEESGTDLDSIYLDDESEVGHHLKGKAHFEALTSKNVEQPHEEELLVVPLKKKPKTPKEEPKDHDRVEGTGKPKNAHGRPKLTHTKDVEKTPEDPNKDGIVEVRIPPNDKKFHKFSAKFAQLKPQHELKIHEVPPKKEGRPVFSLKENFKKEDPNVYTETLKVPQEPEVATDFKEAPKENPKAKGVQPEGEAKETPRPRPEDQNNIQKEDTSEKKVDMEPILVKISKPDPSKDSEGEPGHEDKPEELPDDKKKPEGLNHTPVEEGVHNGSKKDPQHTGEKHPKPTQKKPEEKHPKPTQKKLEDLKNTPVEEGAHNGSQNHPTHPVEEHPKPSRKKPEEKHPKPSQKPEDLKKHPVEEEAPKVVEELPKLGYGGKALDKGEKQHPGPQKSIQSPLHVEHPKIEPPMEERDNSSKDEDLGNLGLPLHARFNEENDSDDIPVKFEAPVPVKPPTTPRRGDRLLFSDKDPENVSEVIEPFTKKNGSSKPSDKVPLPEEKEEPKNAYGRPKHVHSKLHHVKVEEIEDAELEQEEKPKNASGRPKPIHSKVDYDGVEENDTWRPKDASGRPKPIHSKLQEEYAKLEEEEKPSGRPKLDHEEAGKPKDTPGKPKHNHSKLEHIQVEENEYATLGEEGKPSGRPKLGHDRDEAIRRLLERPKLVHAKLDRPKVEEADPEQEEPIHATLDEESKPKKPSGRPKPVHTKLDYTRVQADEDAELEQEGPIHATLDEGSNPKKPFGRPKPIHTEQDHPKMEENEDAELEQEGNPIEGEGKPSGRPKLIHDGVEKTGKSNYAFGRPKPTHTKLDHDRVQEDEEAELELEGKPIEEEEKPPGRPQLNHDRVEEMVKLNHATGRPKPVHSKLDQVHVQEGDDAELKQEGPIHATLEGPSGRPKLNHDRVEAIRRLLERPKLIHAKLDHTRVEQNEDQQKGEPEFTSGRSIAEHDRVETTGEPKKPFGKPKHVHDYDRVEENYDAVAERLNAYGRPNPIHASLDHTRVDENEATEAEKPKSASGRPRLHLDHVGVEENTTLEEEGPSGRPKLDHDRVASGRPKLSDHTLEEMKEDSKEDFQNGAVQKKLEHKDKEDPLDASVSDVNGFFKNEDSSYKKELLIPEISIVGPTPGQVEEDKRHRQISKKIKLLQRLLRLKNKKPPKENIFHKMKKVSDVKDDLGIFHKLKQVPDVEEDFGMFHKLKHHPKPEDRNLFEEFGTPQTHFLQETKKHGPGDEMELKFQMKDYNGRDHFHPEVMKTQFQDKHATLSHSGEDHVPEKINNYATLSSSKNEEHVPEEPSKKEYQGTVLKYKHKDNGRAYIEVKKDNEETEDLNAKLPIFSRNNFGMETEDPYLAAKGKKPKIQSETKKEETKRRLIKYLQGIKAQKDAPTNQKQLEDAPVEERPIASQMEDLKKKFEVKPEAKSKSFVGHHEEDHQRPHVNEDAFEEPRVNTSEDLSLIGDDNFPRPHVNEDIFEDHPRKRILEEIFNDGFSEADSESRTEKKIFTENKTRDIPPRFRVAKIAEPRLTEEDEDDAEAIYKHLHVNPDYFDLEDDEHKTERELTRRNTNRFKHLPLEEDDGTIVVEKVQKKKDRKEKASEDDPFLFVKNKRDKFQLVKANKKVIPNVSKVSQIKILNRVPIHSKPIMNEDQINDDFSPAINVRREKERRINQPIVIEDEVIDDDFSPLVIVQSEKQRRRNYSRFPSGEDEPMKKNKRKKYRVVEEVEDGGTRFL